MTTEAIDDPTGQLEKLSDAMMMVEGVRVTPQQYRAFEAYFTGQTPTAALRILKDAGIGISRRTFFTWKNQPWWQVLHDRIFKDAQEKFQRRVADKADEFAKGLIDVVSGDDKSDRTAMARVSAAKLFSEMGRDPLVQRSPHVQINNNQKFQTLITGEKLADILRLMLPDELTVYSLTGRMPVRLEDGGAKPELEVIESDDSRAEESADVVG